MSNAKQAADGIRNVAVKFRGFLEAADYLDKIGDLEYMHDDRAMSPNVKEAIRLQICILSDARQRLSEPSNA